MSAENSAYIQNWILTLFLEEVYISWNTLNRRVYSTVCVCVRVHVSVHVCSFSNSLYLEIE